MDAGNIGGLDRGTKMQRKQQQKEEPKAGCSILIYGPLKETKKKFPAHNALLLSNQVIRQQATEKEKREDQKTEAATEESLARRA